MSIVSTPVYIDSQGHCPDPDSIVSEVGLLDIIIYELLPVSAGQNISAWQFMVFLTRKDGGGTLPLTLGLGGSAYFSALVLPTLAAGTYEVNLKIKNSNSGQELLIDPRIIRR